MTNLKKFTLICGIVFLISALAGLILVPMCVDDVIDTYNEMVSQPLESIYNDTVLGENIKNIRVANNYTYIETRKSDDGKVHIRTLNAGMTEFTVEVIEDEDSADLYFHRKNLKAINKENIARFIQLASSDTPAVIMYLPEDAEVVAASPYMNIQNPYTLKYYPSINNESFTPDVDVNDDIIADSSSAPTESAEENADGMTSSEIILMINETRNELRDLQFALDDVRAEVMSMEKDLSDYSDGFDSYYEDIMECRLRLVDLVYQLNKNEEQKSEMENLVYNLTNYEQSIDISNLRVKIVYEKYDEGFYSRDEYNKVKNEEAANIADYEVKVAELSAQFKEYINLNTK